jgi:hypothetical protein
MLPGTRFEARNFISEPGPQELYGEMFFGMKHVPSSKTTSKAGKERIKVSRYTYKIFICQWYGK